MDFSFFTDGRALLWTCIGLLLYSFYLFTKEEE